MAEASTRSVHRKARESRAPAGNSRRRDPDLSRHRGDDREHHYQRGAQGKPFEEPFNEDEIDAARMAYEAGRSDREQMLNEEPEPSPSSPTRVASPSSTRSSSSAASDGAGVLLGAFVYALVMNYLQGGAAQARGWMAAKFLNKPFTGTRPAPAKPSGPDRATAVVPATSTRLVPAVRGYG